MGIEATLNHCLLIVSGMTAANLGLKTLLVFAVAGAVLLGLRRASAAARHLVCLLTLAALLALPLFSLTLPGWHLPMLVSPLTPNPEGTRLFTPDVSPSPSSPRLLETAPNAAQKQATQRTGITDAGLKDATSNAAAPAPPSCGILPQKLGAGGFLLLLPPRLPACRLTPAFGPLGDCTAPPRLRKHWRHPAAGWR